jgi:prolyl-tRNA synthetase
MRISQSFSKTIREVPADETAVNAKLLIKAGFITKVMAGVYEYMPLGNRVLNKINNIIREEMNAVGGQELFMSVMQSRETWMTTGRWDSANDVMYQFKDSAGHHFGLGFTHEEPLTAAASRFISSYKDLPKAVYQIQTKFRNEERAKSGLLRGREFLMKDLYSFHAEEEDLDEYYEKVAVAYKNIFDRVGVKAIRTHASGGMFSQFSDEYQVLADIGEDFIYVCEECGYSENKEIHTAGPEKCVKCGGKLFEKKSIEVGNIFKLGTRFSEALNLVFTDKDGNRKPVIMASYGIGPGRLMGTIVEVSHDDRGMIWPDSVAPFHVHLIVLDGKTKEADKLYADLQKKGIEVLYDDRDDKSAGEKFADADLIGCPLRMVISNKTLDKKSVEIKKRTEKEFKLITLLKAVESTVLNK